VTRIGQPSSFVPSGGLASLPILASLASLPRLATATVVVGPDRSPIRQRTKFWELNNTVHCSVIGTCLTTGELRRVMGKLTRTDVSRFSDHDLHSEAVGLCSFHNACSKLLQKTLDGRHQGVIKQFARLQGETVVLERWLEARRAGEIPGAYWAVLTHPDVTQLGIRQAFGDVHMLSHLVGAANRADIRRLAALEDANALLQAKVERQQTRLHEAITARDATLRHLGTVTATDVTYSARPDADDAREALRHLVADLQTRLAAETGRRERLDRRLADASQAAQRWEGLAKDAELERAALHRELAALERQQNTSEPAQPVLALSAQRILYVGGRPGCIEQMRGTLQAAGGELLCHDGGRHDHPSLLPGLISQADRVLFPVDCVSHDAALTVKRLCRQLGKRWSPLRSSGLGSFLAVLTEAIVAESAEFAAGQTS